MGAPYTRSGARPHPRGAGPVGVRAVDLAAPSGLRLPLRRHQHCRVAPTAPCTQLAPTTRPPRTVIAPASALQPALRRWLPASRARCWPRSPASPRTTTASPSSPAVSLLSVSSPGARTASAAMPNQTRNGARVQLLQHGLHGGGLMSRRRLAAHPDRLHPLGRRSQRDDDDRDEQDHGGVDHLVLLVRWWINSRCGHGVAQERPKATRAVPPTRIHSSRFGARRMSSAERRVPSRRRAS